MIDGNVLFNNADYKVSIKVTKAGSLTASSAGITVCSLVPSARLDECLQVVNSAL